MLQAYKNYVLVIPDNLEELAGGLVQIEKRSDLPMSGMIAPNSPSPFSDNTRVYFKAFAGEDINWGGKMYKVVHEQDIVAFEVLKKGVK